MKLTVLAILLSFLGSWASQVYSQTTRLNLEAKDINIEDFFRKIEDQSEYRFFYSGKIDVERTISGRFENKLITEVLDNVLKNTDIKYEMKGRQIILSPLETFFSVEQQQQKFVSGKVTDSTGGGLPGVSVVVKGTTSGVITDMDGKYSLAKVPENATLQFSFVGMMGQEIVVGGKTTVNVTLVEEAVDIEEVVAIGYGTQKKVNLTGSVETIDGARLAKQPVAQASQALMGLSPGLTVVQSSGQPGNDKATLRIRGIGSIGASNDPLILIDGIEGDINSLDANDIGDISVLKDAAAASIYGSRASNGVILVTTKRAKGGVVSVSYNNYIGWQKPDELPKYLGALDFLKYSGASQSFIDNYAANMGTNPDKYPDTDWVNELFSENGFQQYHNLSVNGGSDKVKVLASLAYTDQGGNIKSYDFQRYNGRFNSDMKFSDKFDINFDLSFSKSVSKSPSSNLSSGTSAANILEFVTLQAFRIPPIYSSVHSDGTWGDGWAGTNPIANVNAGGYSNDYTNYFRGVIKANYSPIPGLKFSVMYAPEYNDGYNKAFIKTYQEIIDWDAKTTRTSPARNSLSQTNDRTFTDNFNALASYTKTYKSHTVTGLVGYEFIKDQFERFSASRTDFILQNYEVLSAGSEANDANAGSATHSGLVSYFGRINYSFRDRYLIEANIRRDASSRFAAGNRVAVFPAFSAGWRLSEEKFIKNLKFFSNLKLRASWGQLGNQQIGSDFPYAASITMGKNNYVFGNSVVNGATQDVMANPSIKWETTETSNIGLDAGLFKQRLSITADYYIRKTKDILLNLPIPLDLGLSPSMQNIGDLENRGWDFSLNWQDKIGDFSYGARLNLSDVKNEVTNLGGAKKIIGWNSVIQVGSPIGLIYGYETAGVFQDVASIASAPAQFGALKPGNLQYKDQLTVDSDGDGIFDKVDGKINPDDRVVLGNPFPRMTYGLDLNAGYKGFDLSVSLQGVGKRDVLLGGDAVWPMYNAGKIQEWHVTEFWSTENTGAKFPILAATSSGSNDIMSSSTWVFDASYLRVRNITIGYTIPKTVLKRISIEDLRIYFSGQNLFTFDKLPEGMDPLTPNDTQGNFYPITSSFTMGLNLKF